RYRCGRRLGQPLRHLHYPAHQLIIRENRINHSHLRGLSRADQVAREQQLRRTFPTYESRQDKSCTAIRRQANLYERLIKLCTLRSDHEIASQREIASTS